MMRMKVASASLVLALSAALASPSASAAPPLYKGHRATELLSFGGQAAWAVRHPSVLRRLSAIPGLEDDNPFLDPDAPLAGVPYAPDESPAPGGGPGEGGGRRNVFVNDPCLDPPPPNRRRTVQSETELAVLNSRSSRGKKIVVGYNDSYGFYDNTQGLSGVSYSVDGGKSFIDASGLPPLIKSKAACGTPGTDCYAGDPVVVVHNAIETFYYASIYLTPNGFQTLSVNRGHFERAPPQTIESRANTRCAKNPAAYGVPDPPEEDQERIIWEPPVVAVSEAELGGGPSPDPASADALDKEWLYVDQRTGELYLTYTRFGIDGSTPIEMVRSFDGGRTWTPPSTIVPNLDDTFNQATQPIVTRTGRVIVTWHARTFALFDPFPEISQRIEAAYSDNDGLTFGPPVTVSPVNPQGEPLGYNRRRLTFLNAPYIATDRFGTDDDQGDGNDRYEDGDRSAGKVYVAYFDGTTPLPVKPVPRGTDSQGPGNPFARSANIKLSTSRDDGATWDPPVKVNSDDGRTSHVFPSVQVNRQHKVFVAWTDRRRDPEKNVLNDVWAAAAKGAGRAFGGNVRVTDVSTSWYKRADARPNFGDYNSSELIDFERFATVWADGRFPPGSYVPPACSPKPPPGAACPPSSAGTPDTLFSIVPALPGDGQGGGSGQGGGN
ncbi:MAG: hypothetical protein NVS2B9_06910 [Myxococcales bacterium]